MPTPRRHEKHHPRYSVDAEPVLSFVQLRIESNALIGERRYEGKISEKASGARELEVRERGSDA
jgi:hypothetical protein